MNNPDHFTLASLTESINQIPALPTKIGNSKLFTPKPISTTQVMIDEKQGKLTEQELKGDGVKPAMSARLFAMPEAVRDDFKALLTARYGVASDDKQELSSFRGEQPNSVDEETEMTKEAQGLVREGKFTNFREAFVHVRANYKKNKEEGK